VNLAVLAKSSSCSVTADRAQDEFERTYTDAGIRVWLVILKRITHTDGFLRCWRRESRATLEHNRRLPVMRRWFDGGCILITGEGLLELGLVVVLDRIIIYCDISFLIVSFERMKDLAGGLGNNLQQHFFAVDWQTWICREHLYSSALSVIVNINSDPKRFSFEHCQFLHDFLHIWVSCGILLDDAGIARAYSVCIAGRIWRRFDSFCFWEEPLLY